jgi:hypothetical protein
MTLPVGPFYTAVLIGFGIGTGIIAVIGAFLTFNFLYICLAGAALSSMLGIFYDFMDRCEEEASKYERRR